MMEADPALAPVDRLRGHGPGTSPVLSRPIRIEGLRTLNPCLLFAGPVSLREVVIFSGVRP